MSRFALATMLLAACAAEEGADSGKGGWDTAARAEAPSDGDADSDVDSDADGDADEDGDTAPPEEEGDFLKLAPAATVSYVFVANRDRGTLSRIRVEDLRVDTVAVGASPALVLTTPGGDAAITLDVGDDALSLVDASDLAVTTVGIRDNLNQMEMSPDGAWIMAWYDPDADEEGGAGDGGVVSYSDVSFVEVATAAHWPMSAGSSPQMVEWSEDGRRAVVVSEKALAVVDLDDEELIPRLIDLGGGDDAVAEEVVLSRDGTQAYVRQYQGEGVLVVDLDAETIETVDIGTNPTDFDITPDGESLAVVARASHQLVFLDLSDPSAPPEVVDFPSDTLYGSIAFPSSDRAILYTNASPVAMWAEWESGETTMTEHTLVKPVEEVGLMPDGSGLLFFHTLADAPGADSDSPFYGNHALTVVATEDARATPLLLPAAVTGWAASDDSRWAFFIMEGRSLLEAVNLGTQLYDEVVLPSAPVWVGVLPDEPVAYANQEYDLGRLSFYNADEGTIDTITGFELNSEIDHEE
jgi:DNA-binding beta-propeller fold protein YncE